MSETPDPVLHTELSQGQDPSIPNTAQTDLDIPPAFREDLTQLTQGVGRTVASYTQNPSHLPRETAAAIFGESSRRYTGREQAVLDTVAANMLLALGSGLPADVQRLSNGKLEASLTLLVGPTAQVRYAEQFRSATERVAAETNRERPGYPSLTASGVTKVFGSVINPEAYGEPGSGSRQRPRHFSSRFSSRKSHHGHL